MAGPIKQGQIWVANLNPRRDSESGKVRPVLIVQGDWLSEAQSHTLVVLPLTTSVQPKVEPLRITIAACDGLLADSQVVVEQPRTLDRRRIADEPLAELSTDEDSPRGGEPACRLGHIPAGRALGWAYSWT